MLHKKMMTLLCILTAIVSIYVLLTLVLTHLVHQLPRQPIVDPPDWGRVTDTRIETVDGGSLEVWRIEPEMPAKGIVVLAHGWGRNRDRMVQRARLFGQWGYTTVIHSARDHGGSSRRRWMNAFRFAEDIEAVLNWVAEPVILYGHSAGSAGAIIAAHRHPQQVRLLFLEACYADTQRALRSLYRWFNPLFGFLFARSIVFCMHIIYHGRMDTVSPARLAPRLRMPVMLIHGQADRRFPLQFALDLKAAFDPQQVEIYVAPSAGHSDSSLTPGYGPAVRAFLQRRLETG